MKTNNLFLLIIIFTNYIYEKKNINYCRWFRSIRHLPSPSSLKKKYKVIITTRSLAQAKKKIPIINKNLKISKLDILNKKKIDFFIKKISPNLIFYFAGQSSPTLSFKKNKLTYLSNVNGCKNFWKY